MSRKEKSLHSRRGKRKQDREFSNEEGTFEGSYDDTRTHEELDMKTTYQSNKWGLVKEVVEGGLFKKGS